MKVRHATWQDAQWLVQQLPAFADDIGCPELLPSDPNVAGLLAMHYIEDHLWLIALDGDERVGFILGWIGPHPFNPDLLTLTSAMWYVVPEYRASRAGLMLLDAFIEWGERHTHYIYIAMHGPSGDNALRRRGFSCDERTYSKRGHL